MLLDDGTDQAVTVTLEPLGHGRVEGHPPILPGPAAIMESARTSISASRPGARPLEPACDDRTVSTYAAQERAQLVEALRAVPADAPTLCEGWTALDLAAHVVARERRIDSTPGLVVPALAGWTEKVRAGIARRPYPEVIQLIADGPPWTSLFALPGVDSAANFSEFAIHTEDVRRGRPGWSPRDLDPGEQDEIWKGLRSRGRMFFRSAPVAVVLALPDGRRQAVAGDGPHVTLTGEPLELLLYSAGRRGAAQVEVSGADDAVRKFTGMKLGF